MLEFRLVTTPSMRANCRHFDWRPPVGEVVSNMKIPQSLLHFDYNFTHIVNKFIFPVIFICNNSLHIASVSCIREDSGCFENKLLVLKEESSGCEGGWKSDLRGDALAVFGSRAHSTSRIAFAFSFGGERWRGYKRAALKSTPSIPPARPRGRPRKKIKVDKTRSDDGSTSL